MIGRPTLQQILVGKEYRYRDVATAREYTALEARQLAGPLLVLYLDDIVWRTRHA